MAILTMNWWSCRLSRSQDWGHLLPFWHLQSLLFTAVWCILKVGFIEAPSKSQICTLCKQCTFYLAYRSPTHSNQNGLFDPATVSIYIIKIAPAEHSTLQRFSIHTSLKLHLHNAWNVHFPNYTKKREFMSEKMPMKLPMMRCRKIFFSF